MPVHPSLYQLNARATLTALSRAIGRPASLDDLPDAQLDHLKTLGFDWIWLLSVWETGDASQDVARSDAHLRRAFVSQLPDLREPDIAGSGFAIKAYTVAPSLGGHDALARLRRRMGARGLRLMVDFVPNHTALDHPWVRAHSDYYVHGTEEDLRRSPSNYTRADGGILAYGRDPNYPGWTDTLQLDYANPATCDAVATELMSVARQADGVRCDMAMLILPEVFERTWGRPAWPFWGEAIRRVKAEYPDFLFVAEAYWDLEWPLLQLGFDYAYDKRLYDRLRGGLAGPVREHLTAAPEYQSHLVRFLENHDEARAAATFAPDVHRAAAVVTYLSPGLRFFHQGQMEGRRVRISPQLIRWPEEPIDRELASFYLRLLAVMRRAEARSGRWRLFECAPAWDGNETSAGILAWGWQDGAGSATILAAVNFCDHQSQSYVRLAGEAGYAGSSVVLEDLLSSARYTRDGTALASSGLYLDLPPWGCHVFDIKSRSSR